MEKITGVPGSDAARRSKDEYNRLAQQWEQSIRSYPFRMEVMYPNIIEGLGIRDENERVLDLACGSGYLTNMIAQKAVAYGVDHTKEMIDQARILYPNVQFFQADIRSLPLQDGSIDAISSSCAYHYAENFEELSKMLKESGRVIRSGGRVSGVLSDPDHPVNEWVEGSVRSAAWIDEPYKSGGRISIGVHDPRTGERQGSFTVYYYSSEEYRRAFADAGFEFAWQEYRPSEEFLNRPNAKELMEAVQVRLFSAIKQ